MKHLCTQAIAVDALLHAQRHDCGAQILFTGTVRAQNEGRAVRGMHYSAHEVLAENALAAMCSEALEKFAISHCHIVHRLGEMVLGDISVAITVSSPHRDAAYQASRWLIETLKQRVPIWKEERYVDGDSAFLDGHTLEQAL